MRFQHIKNILLLAGCTFAFFASAQEKMPAKYQSLLWEISGKGMARPSYLYGTMHVSDKMVFNLPDSFFVALKNCNIVALELDMERWMDDLMLIQDASQNKNTSFYSETKTGFYKNAFKMGIPEKKDLISLLQFNPSMSNKLLYRSNRNNSDYEEDNYLDVFIFQAGKKLNKKMIGLENYKRSQELFIKSEDEPDRTDDEDKKEEEIREQKRVRLKELTGGSSYRDMLDNAYRRGDLDLLDSIGNLTRTDNFIKHMLYERNQIMADQMDSVLHTSCLFTGVGAAHLPGPNGMIELLRKKGYTVRPVVSPRSDIQSKKEIDEMRYPTRFISQSPADSAFSVSVPGKLCEVKDGRSLRYYLFNDMSNGSYYCVQRMMHYGKLLGQTQEHILKRIDSLIFENIPGKLISKTGIKSANGYPGIEVINKTGKGDLQRHQIFITPHEILSFKMHGPQEYVKNGQEADRFFSSIRFYESPAANPVFKSKFGYQAAIPGVRSVYSAYDGRNSVQNECVHVSSSAGNDHSLIMAASLYDFDYIEEDTFELNILSERFCLEANKKMLSRSILKQDRNPSIWFSLGSKENKGPVYHARITISGPDYYLLCTSMDSISALQFFNSFETSEKTYKAPFTRITDTSLFFSVSGQEIKNDYSSLVVARNSGSFYGYKSKNEEKKNMLLPRRSVKVYRSPETNEKVFVEFRKFSTYFHEESMEEFWKSRVESVNEKNSMKVSRAKTYSAGGNSFYELLLTDTASSRGVLVKFIQHCGTQYVLKAVIDTAKGPDGFTKTFFESFAIKDTCMGTDFLSDKLGKYFFDKIYSSDSLESKNAKAAIEYVQANVLPANVPALIKTIRNKQAFDKLSANEKRTLIFCFPGVKSPEVLSFLEGLYAQYSDSVDVQISILRELSYAKTERDVTTFLKLLKEDLPVMGSESDMEDLFEGFRDSLEMAKSLFPELLRYTKYPEYSTAIYDLMAELVEKKKMRPKVYSGAVDGILLDARHDLKKYIAEKDRDREASKYSYSYQSYDRPFDNLNSDQQAMYKYVCLLAPFYRNADVQKFFNKLLASSQSEKFKAAVYGFLIANDAKLPDSIAAHYSNSVKGKLMFYWILDSQNKINCFDKKCIVQKNLVLSQLLSDKNNFEKDTVVIMAIHKAEVKNKPGYVYVFKSKVPEKKIWKLSYSALHPIDTTQINFSPEFTKTDFSFQAEAQANKEIESLLRKIRVDGHKRASVSDLELSTGKYDYDNW